MTNRAKEISLRADELGIDPFTAYTIADDAIDYLDDPTQYHRTDEGSISLLTFIMLHFSSDDDFDDLRHELRHEWNNFDEFDICDNCNECDYCCECDD